MFTCLRRLRGQALLKLQVFGACAVCGTIGMLLLTTAYSSIGARSSANALARSKISDLSVSTSEVYAQLARVLSPANQQATCRSLIFPGGKCNCVDATPDNEESCFLVPIMDGKKTVCLDILRPGAPCLVYSFGIKDDLSFETEMVRFGCTVHAFDPTVRINATITPLPAGLHVHNIGVDGHTWRHVSDGGEMQLMSLDQIVRHLGHEGRRIDYVKLDVEGSEWAVLKDQLGGGATLLAVPQFSVELHMLFPNGILSADPSKKLHLARDDALRYLETMEALQAAGFRLLESRPDHGKYQGTNVSYIYETAWVKQN